MPDELFPLGHGPGQVSIRGELSAPRDTRRASERGYRVLFCDDSRRRWYVNFQTLGKVPDDELRQTPGSLVTVPFAIAVQRCHGAV